MPLSADRNTPVRTGDEAVYGVKAGVTIYAGALVVLQGGYARPGRTATGDVAVGRAEERAVGGGSDGAVTCRVRRGVFRFANSSAGDAITAAEIGSTCYVVDDQTVAKTNGSSTRSAAGVVWDVDASGVWVKI